MVQMRHRIFLISSRFGYDELRRRFPHREIKLFGNKLISLLTLPCLYFFALFLCYKVRLHAKDNISFAYENRRSYLIQYNYPTETGLLIKYFAFEKNVYTKSTEISLFPLISATYITKQLCPCVCIFTCCKTRRQCVTLI